MKICYLVGWKNPNAHLFDIRMQIEDVREDSLAVAMPAWVPGSYEILDSARHVQEFEAWAGNKRLPWKRLDKQTWQIRCKGARAVEIRYRLFANTVNCTASSLDATHAHITGGTAFLYLSGHLDAAHELQFEIPSAQKSWKIATGLASRRGGKMTPGLIFSAPDYDTLIDCPIEISDFVDHEFTVAGKRHHMVLHDYGHESKNGRRYARDCAKFVKYFHGLMGGFPYDQYWFLCHFHPTIAKGGGLEHKNSTHISIPAFLDSEDEKDYERALEFASHEFFHLWNVKRMKPEGLGPFDYTREAYTSSLWVAEGITEYYGEHALRRSGIWDRQKYLDALAKMIDSLRDMPGERTMSLKESSLTTWTNATWHRLRAPDDVNLLNSYVNYYVKGALLGWLLDLEIRRVTKGRRSLDHVIRKLWQRYGKIEKPYPEHAIEELVEEVAGPQTRRWLAKELSTAKPLPFEKMLRRCGLSLRFLPVTKKEESEKDRRKIEASIGVEIQESGDAVRVANVLPDSPAERAGIDKGDQLLALDGEKLNSGNWRTLFRQKSKLARVEIALFRHHRLLRIEVRPQMAVRTFAKLELDPKASLAARRIAESWIGR